MAAQAQAHSLQQFTKTDAGLRARTMQQEAKGQNSRIQDVWIDNFFEAIEEISLLLEKFNYISMVKHFPTNSFPWLKIVIFFRIAIC